MKKEIDVPMTAAPEKLSYQFFKLDVPDWIVLGVAIFGSTRAKALVDSVIVNILGLILAVYVLWPLINGRRYYVVAMEIYARMWIDKVCESVEWSALPRADLKRWKRTLVGWSVKLFHPDPFPYLIDELFNIGLLYVKSLRSDTIIVKGNGSEFSRLTPTEQGAKLELLATIMRDYSRRKGLRARVGLMARRRPVNPLVVIDKQLESMRVNAYLPEIVVRCRQQGLALTTENILAVASDDEAVRDEELAEYNYYLLRLQAEEAANRIGLEPDLVALLTIKRSARLRLATRKRKGKQLDESEAENESIVQLAREFKDQLDVMGVQSTSILTPEEVADFVRAGWDVIGLQDYYVRRAKDTSPGKRATAMLFRPQHLIASRQKSASFDDNELVTLRLVRHPHEVSPSAMMALFDNLATETYLTRTLTSEVVRGNWQYFGATWFLNIVDSLMMFFRGNGLSRARRTEENRDKLDASVDVLARQRYAMFFSQYVTLSVSQRRLQKDPQIFERDIRRIRMAITGDEFELEPVENTAWTRRAALSGSIGVALI